MPPQFNSICPVCGKTITQRQRKHCSMACANRSRALSVDACFWSRVRKTDTCWLWTGPKGKYGMMSFQGRSIGAHRFSYELHNGPIPDGMSVCHRCDTPLCVNPAHLFFGTIADNAHDRTGKGRDARGERGGMAKLTDADVADIRARYTSGQGQVLADEFGITRQTVRRIVTHQGWKHIA